ncbi:MAG: hypothetical protein ACI8S6_004831, partial [Myxococcota bacterium]
MSQEQEIASLKRRLAAVEDTLGDIAKDVHLSISYAESDPGGSAAKCGRALEGLLKQLHQDLIGAPPSNAAINKLRNSLDKKLPSVIRTYMDAVQRLRNVGAHHNDSGLSTHDALVVLHAFLLIAEWYAENTRPPPESRPERNTTTDRSEATWWILGGVAVTLIVAAAGSLLVLASTSSQRPSEAARLPNATSAMSAQEPPSDAAVDGLLLLDRLRARASEVEVSLGRADYFAARTLLIEAPCGDISPEERAKRLEENELSLEAEPLRDALWLQLQRCGQEAREDVLAEALAAESQEDIEGAWIIVSGLPAARGREVLARRHEDMVLSGGEDALRADLTGPIIKHIDQQWPLTPPPVTLAPPDREAGSALHRTPIRAETVAYIALLEEAIFATPSGPEDAEAVAVEALEEEFLSAGCMPEERPQRQALLMTWQESPQRVRLRGLRDGIADCWGRERRQRAVVATQRWPDAALREVYIAL